MKLMNKLCVCLLVCTAPVFAQKKIEVFTEGPATIDQLNEIEVIHYDLSEPTRIKKQLAPKLPADEKTALAQAKEFFKSDAGKHYQREMRDAYRGRQKMMQYQLTKIPVIVFDDGRYVIYGSTDVIQSLQLYREHQRDSME